MTGNLDVTPCLGTEGPRFLHGEDWQAAGYAGLVALMLYVATMSPTVTLEFSGALGVGLTCFVDAGRRLKNWLYKSGKLC